MTSDIRVFDDVLSQSMCQSLIQKFSEDPAVKEDPQPDYSTRLYANLSLMPSWRKEVMSLATVTNQIVAEYFERPEGWEEVTVTDWTDDGFVMARYRCGDGLILHTDGQCAISPNNGLRLATVLMFLNDCPSGALEFPIQDISIDALCGRAVVFPPTHTHPHQVPTVASDRFVVQTWITDPDMVVVSRSDSD